MTWLTSTCAPCPLAVQQLQQCHRAPRRSCGVCFVMRMQCPAQHVACGWVVHPGDDQSRRFWGQGLRVAAQAEFKQEQVAGAAASKNAPANVPVEHAPAIGGAALAALGGRPEEEAGQGEEALDAKDAAALEALRNDIFMRGAIPWWAALQLPWPCFVRLVCLTVLGIGGGCAAALGSIVAAWRRFVPRGVLHRAPSPGLNC